MFFSFVFVAVVNLCYRERILTGKSAFEVSLKKQAKKAKKIDEKKARTREEQAEQEAEALAEDEDARLARKRLTEEEQETLTRSAQNVPPFVFTDLEAISEAMLEGFDLMWCRSQKMFKKESETLCAMLKDDGLFCFCSWCLLMSHNNSVFF